MNFLMVATSHLYAKEPASKPSKAKVTPMERGAVN